MFGYLRPLPCELKMRDYEAYKAHYCGLCHTLAGRYGFRARFLLQYDMLFYYFAQSLSSPPTGFTRRRCPVHPFKKRCQARCDEHFEAAADLTVLLFDSKLQDTLADEKGLRRWSAKLLGRLLLRPIRKARDHRPAWHEAALQMSRELADIERLGVPSLDRPAHAFASFLSCLAQDASGQTANGMLAELYYHAGRWIYLIDALDDLRDDLKRGRYNPVALRFALTETPVTRKDSDFLARSFRPEQRELLELTLAKSRAAMRAALHSLPDHPAMAILYNMVDHGMPMVERLVWQGRWQKKRRTKQLDNGPHPLSADIDIHHQTAPKGERT